jgi:hypothetical protein
VRWKRDGKDWRLEEGDDCRKAIVLRAETSRGVIWVWSTLSAGPVREGWSYTLDSAKKQCLKFVTPAKRGTGK